MKKIFTKQVLFILALIFVIGPLIAIQSLPLLTKALGAPDLSILEDYQPIGSIEVYDYRDNFVGVLQGKEDRQVVKLDQISDYMKQAILAAEDAEFFEHSGFSITSTSRAMIKNIMAGRIVQGGSTITQQMVKNLFIKEDERYKRTFTRKIVELLIAFEVEAKYSKEKILEIYLNQVYFGNLAYGIERASQRYFSKHAKDLNLMEASFLGGMLTAPSYFAQHRDKALERQKYVLKQMNAQGFISDIAYQTALKSKTVFNESTGNMSKFPYYFSYIEQQLKKRFTRNDLKTLGLKVYTGMDPVAQEQAIKSLNLGIKNAAQGINQGALVSVDVDTAQVRALVGGVGSFWQNQYNRAVNKHTLGSGFKPFLYLTAFRKGTFDPNSIVLDEELKIKDISLETGFWTPQNFDHEFHGPITVRAALTFSRNVPAIKIAMRTGIENIIETARRAGIKSRMQPLLSLALGAQAFTPLEVAGAYATFARRGTQIDPIVIRKITDSKGRVLELNRPIAKNSLPEKDIATLVDIMTDVVRFGTGAVANIPGRVIAGKTGTADGSRDIWFTGFTPNTVTTVWAGNENNEEVVSRYATGGSTPAWTWRNFMSAYLKARPVPVRSFNFGENYITLDIDPLTGLLATEYTPNPVSKKFIPGTEPKDYAPIPEIEEIKTRKKHKKSRIFSTSKTELSKEDKRIKKAKKISNQEQEDELFERVKDLVAPTKITPKPKILSTSGSKD